MSQSSTEPNPPNMLYVIKQLELVSRARLDEVLRPAGITALQYTALTVLARRPQLTSADLARMSFTRAQSAADLVAALVRRGLVNRTADPSNRRRLLLQLTDQGNAVLAEYDPLVAQLEAHMMAGFTDDEADVFRRLLRRARHSLEHAVE